MKNHLIRAIIFLTTFLFALQPLSPLLFVSPVLAQEASSGSDSAQLPFPTLEASSTPTPTALPTPLLSSEPSVALTPTITTDKSDYSPFDFAVISGAGFTADSSYGLLITSGTDYAFRTSLTTDASGGFNFTYFLDGTYRPAYAIQILKEGNVLASASFTDTPSSGPLGKDFKQCANMNPTPGSCDWIGSILQQGNSQYLEGMGVPQRLLLTDIPVTPGNTHTLTFSHQANKATSHAYDFITGYNQGNSPAITLNPCAGLNSGLTTICETLRGGAPVPVAAPDNMGTELGADVEARVHAFETAIGENRAIQLYGNQSISSPSLSFTGYTSDDEGYANYTLTWTSASSNLLIEMAGHLAVGGDGTGVSYGAGKGSSNISGGPYHFKLSQLDGGALGNQDNQIKGADVLAQVQAHLTVIKHVVNDNGGTLNANNFTMQVTGTNVSSPSFAGSETGTTIDLDAGTYSVDETGVAGYAKTLDPSCSGTIVAGETKSCTITNNDIAPTLTLIKTVVNDHGGSANPSNFQAKIDEGNVPWAAAQVVSAGTHLASEESGLGYTASAWGGDCSADGSITLSLGQNKTCTITNTDQPGTLIIRKVVVNDNGGTKHTEDFSFQVNESEATAFEQDGENELSVDAGLYTIVEPAEAGYDTTYNNCADVQVTNGGTATCTITNNDQPGHIVINKTTLGGDDSFAFSVIGPSASSPTITSSEGSGTTGSLTVNAGAYSILELAKAGWDLTDSSCDSGSAEGFVVANGGTVTCSFANTKRGHILVTKNAVPNDGQDFTFHDNFGGSNPATFLLDDDANGTLPKTLDFEVIPGSGYAVSEETVGGWKQDTQICSEEDNTPGNITVNPGETVTCTFTNKKLAQLVLVKNTVGGNGSFDFTMTGDSLPSSAHLETANGTATQIFENLDPDNTYSISENSSNDWEQTGANCTGTNTPSEITPNAGEIITCTFSNTKLPKLTITKLVVNDNGGTKTSADFPLFVNGNPVISGVQGIYDLGSYTATESGDPGYMATYSGDCSETGSLTLEAGDEKTCVITNDDIAPALTLVKEVVNQYGGQAVSTDWTLTAAGPTPLSGAGGAVSDVAFSAGIYNLSESSGPNGYQADNWSCSGGTQNADSITLGLGEQATCTLINRDRPATLRITKQADPKDLQDFSFNGGVLGSFILDDDTDVLSENGDINRDQTAVFPNLNVGSYTITETEPNPLWSLRDLSCVNTSDGSPFAASITGTTLNVQLGLGSDVTCTFTNHKSSPTRTLGFWQTHTDYTSDVFSNKMSSSMTIGTFPHKGAVTTRERIFGAFYANIAKTTAGKARTAQDKARMILLQQLVAAKLNCAAFGCDSSASDMITSADNAYFSGVISAMNASTNALDAFNNSGETIVIGNAGKATPKTSQLIADKVFWNEP